MTRTLSWWTVILGLTVMPVLQGCGDPEAAKGNAAKGMTQDDIRTALASHSRFLFDDVKQENEDQFAADKQRVRDIHRLANLVEQYHEKTGRYPLAQEPISRLINVTISPQPQPTSSNSDSVVDVAKFREELRQVLGQDVEIPVDPMPDEHGYAAYNYSVWSKKYAVATYLFHHARFSEKLAPQLHQYRVGCYEDMSFPVIEWAKILRGEYLKSGSDGRRSRR